MKQNIQQAILDGVLLDEQAELTLNDLCCACSSSAEWIIELVEEGALEPVILKIDTKKTSDGQQNQWRFTGYSLQRAQTARRLQRDLGINLAGAALALELLEQISSLQEQLRRHAHES